MPYKAIALSLFVVGACDAATSELSEPIINYGSTPLQRTWMKASHNTYDWGHTFGTITWHFGITTNHVELDLRDSNSGVPGGELTGSWVIAHGANSSELTTACGGGYSLQSCLWEIRTYHLSYPGHPLLTVWLDKKQDWQNTSESTSARSPWRLDNLISSYFSDGELVLPSVIAAGGWLRETVEAYGWPAHSSLDGKIMFVMTSDPGCGGNDRLESYVYSRGPSAKVFVAPSGDSSSRVTAAPQCFGVTPSKWVAIYNFKWQSDSGAGADECTSSTCYYIPTAHGRNYLTRVWDIDDPGEYDAASARSRGGIYGYANFIAVDYPWQQGSTGGYGYYPDGIYPY